jgi:hypothetical protein
VAHQALGSQKEKHEGQDSSGSGGGLMKNLLVKGVGCSHKILFILFAAAGGESKTFNNYQIAQME